VVGHVLNIENHHATLYTGNYSAFERIRAERLAHQQSQFVKQQLEVAHIRSFIDRFRAKASKARQAQSRIKALERMELIAPAHVDSPFHFSLLEPEKLPTPLLRVDHASVGYGETTVLSGMRLSLSPGDRIGLLGPNGAGKSTLIKLLAGTLEMQGGEFVSANDLATGYFAQHQVEQLQPKRSPLEHMFELAPRARELDLRNYLGGFGFPGDTVFMPTGPFSGGEKSRLALALLVFHRPNLLLLDEPTNHLDLEMRQALATALQDFSGAMVIVSHDRHLLRVTTDQLWLVHGGKVSEFDGSLDDYPAWLAALNRSNGNSLRVDASGTDSARRKDQKRREAEQRQRLRPLNRRIEKAEAAISGLQARTKALETRLADSGLYEPDNKDELKAVLEEQADINWRLAKEEANWLEATEAIEQLQ
jgi:ATP-binding cassette subfamily F protein 3